MLANKALGAAPAAVPAYIEDVFSTYLYSGTAANRSITNGIDLSGKGGMVWIKTRNVSDSNYITDTARGTGYYIATNTTGAQAGSGSSTLLSAFNNNGFSLGSAGGFNGSGEDLVSWTFAKQAKFFDVVTFTTNSSSTTNQRISHSLGSTPGMIIVKNTGGASGWLVWHRSLSSATDSYLTLNGTGSTSTYTNGWGTSGPTSTDFGINTALFGTSANYVAYLFAHDAGGFGASGSDNVISCGSYTGNGSATGPTITLGYEPQWILIKNASTGATRWTVTDNMRGFPVTSSAGQQILQPNVTDAEVGVMYIQPTATGFKVVDVDADVNTNGNTYIYIAIRRGPMKTPETGTSVFTPTAFSGNDTSGTRSAGLNAFDLLIAKRRGVNSLDWVWLDKLRGLAGNRWLTSNASTAEAAGDIINTINGQYTQDGINVTKSSNYSYLDSSGNTYVWYALKRAPKFFDIVCYTGNGTSNRAITHNLGVTPELIIVKTRGTANLGMVYTADGGNGKFLRLFASTTSNYAYTTSSSPWNNTSPTSTQFTVDGTGGYIYVNSSTEDYVAYLFASLTGVSKVGAYTGNGSSQTINCGFTAGARFVLIKQTDSAGNWFVFDTARGIVSGGDPLLSLNTTDAEDTPARDALDPDNSGFIVNNDATYFPINVNNATYIYLAIA